MNITKQQILRALVGIATPQNDDLDSFVASFNMWCDSMGINSTKRVIHYLAQVLCESNYLNATEENLNYSSEGLMKTWPSRFDKAKAEAYARKPQKIASYVYANRMGNGNEASGDGWKYRGRGYLQLTGKQNYSDFSKYDLCTRNVLNDPDSVSRYYLNQLSAMWFWEKNKLNAIADTDNGGILWEDVVKRITKVVNGGNNGIAKRLLLYRRLKKEFGFK